MKLLKPTLIALIVLCALCFMPSCSKETPAPDLCADVQCTEYGAECVQGDCVCTGITKDYLLGTWDFINSMQWIRFQDDNILLNSYGDDFEYVVNSIDGIIYLYHPNINFGLAHIFYINEGFDCNAFTFESLKDIGLTTSVTRQQ